MATLKELKKERRLVKHAIKGDRQALERLVIKYINFCYSISITLLENDRLAKLALEDTLTYVYNSVQELYDPNGFQVWLYDILKKSIDKYKPKGSNVTLNIELDKSNGNNDSFNKLQNTDLYMSEKLLNLMKKLPDDQREIVALIDFEGLSCNDAALLLGTDIMTVRAKLYDAKRFLKQVFLRPLENMVNQKLVDVEKE